MAIVENLTYIKGMRTDKYKQQTGGSIERYGRCSNNEMIIGSVNCLINARVRAL